MLPAHFAILIGPPTTAPAPHGRGPNPHRATVERLGARIANVEAFAWQKDRSSPIASARLNFLLERSTD